MRIAIFGCGGVGGYFGARLAQSGEDVIFIARGEHLRVMQTQGLRVDSIAGDFRIDNLNASGHPNQVGTVDAILLGVKTWQVIEAARAMRPMIGPDTIVMPLQNGVEAADQLVEELGQDAVVGGLCGLIAYVVAPGHIRHAGAPPFVKFGELDNRPSERVERLRQAFSGAQGLSVEVPDDIQVALWQKFLLITAWSGIGAVTRSPGGVFRSQPGTRAMLRQAMDEVFQLAHARGVDLPADTVAKTLAMFDQLPQDSSASMQRDIMHNRPSELEAQNGAVVRLGEQAGVATPVNGFIYHSLLALERRARGELQFEI